MSQLQNRGAAFASRLAMNDNAVYCPKRPDQPIIFFGRGVA